MIGGERGAGGNVCGRVVGQQERGGGGYANVCRSKEKQLSAASGRVVKYEIDKVTARYST